MTENNADNTSDFFSKELSTEERNLYDRQFRLKGWNQRILKDAKVLIAGVGGLGCEIAKNLAMVGVGNLILVDLDIIEHSNLNRQILFVDAPIGESKAIAAAKKLQQINPTIKIKGFHSSLEKLHPKAYKIADVIVGGLDSVNARLNLNAQAIRFKKPLIDGGVSGYHGHIYTTFPYDNACYECYAVPESELNDMAACTVVGNPRKRVHCVLKGQMAFVDKYDQDPNPKNESQVEWIQNYANDLVTKFQFPPTFTKKEVVQLIDRHDAGIITINSVIASLQSHETIKVINDLKGNDALGKPNDKYVIYNGMTMKFYHLEKPRNLKCTQCGEEVKREEVIVSPNSLAQIIVDEIVKKGYKEDPDMLPVATMQDFNSIKEIDFDLTINQNRIRDYELITLAGFIGGEIFITIKKPKYK